MKKGDIKKGADGATYTLIKRIGKGGQAEVWKVQSKKDNQFYAYKVYKHNTNNIRSNVEDLIKIGKFKDRNGNVLDSVVLPITTIDGEGDSFGYIMDLVDLQDYTVLKKAWCGKYPSCQAICRIVQNLARFFETLHLSYGMCYKDVNEGNVFFNPATGDIKIIDNDNVGYSDRFTIKGTSGYMAPEVVLGDKPDHKSDRFSLAVFVYRLLVGGFPFEGPYTDDYCKKHNVLPDDARKVIYGTDALFVWHPIDHRNSIESSTLPRLQGQAEYWHRLPDSVKKLFISTFATNLAKDRCAERTTDEEWRKTFEVLESGLVTCPHCGKITFGETGKCFECSQPLKSGVAHKHRAIFKALSAGEAKRELSVYVADVVKGDQVSRNLPSEPLFKILYHKKSQKIGIKNLSRSAWTIISVDRSKTECQPGQIHVLEKGMMIRIIPKTAQLNVLDVI